MSNTKSTRRLPLSCDTIQSSKPYDAIFYLLLGLLILFRFPLIIIPSLLGMSDMEDIVIPLFLNGTYIATGCLICRTRKSLPHFYFSKSALIVFLSLPIIAVLLSMLRNGFAMSVELVRPIMAVVFAIVLRRELFSSDLCEARQRLASVAQSLVAVGAFTTISALLIAWQERAIGRLSGLEDDFYLADLVYGVIDMAYFAGISEEPLFRGFILGMLISRGLTRRRAVAYQSVLFMLAHLYFLPERPISFFIAVPIGGFLFGWIALRHKSIGYSIVAHGMTNSWGQA